MKKTILLVLIGFISSICHAQLSAGLKLNWTVNKFRINNTDANVEYYNKGIYDVSSLTLSGGLMANYKMDKHFSFQSELIYNPFNAGFGKQESYTNNEGYLDYAGNDFKVQQDYLEMPLLAKTSFGHKVTFDVLAGGYVGYLLSAKQSTFDGKLSLPSETIYNAWQGYQQKIIDYPKQNARSTYTSFNAGVLIGLGITVNDRMIFEVRLNRGLVNIKKTGSEKINTMQAQFTVGYFLFRQKKKE